MNKINYTDLKHGDVIFTYKGLDLYSKLIAIFTNSKIIHTSMCLEDEYRNKYIIEALGSGVKIYDPRYFKRQGKVVRLHKHVINKKDTRNILNTYKNTKYSFIDAVKAFLASIGFKYLDISNNKRVQCTELTIQIMIRLNMPIFRQKAYTLEGRKKRGYPSLAVPDVLYKHLLTNEYIVEGEINL